jgi:hypothetical protein
MDHVTKPRNEDGNETENEKTESATFGGNAAPASRFLDDSCPSKVGGFGGSHGCQRQIVGRKSTDYFS